MYQFTYQVTKKRAISLIAGILYMVLPYRLGNIYVRFAFNEFVALAFMPLVFIGLYNLFEEDGKKHYYIAIGTILVFLTHTVTTFYLAIFCLIYVLCNYKKIINIEIIKKISINVVFIILTTMFFWVPMLEAKESADYAIFDDELMYTNSEYVKKMAIDPSILIFGEQNDDSAILIIGVPIIIFGLLTIYTIKFVDKKYKKIYVLFLIFSIACIFMSTNWFPWEYIPDVLCKLQYSWRLLGFMGFFACFVCAVNLYILVSKFKISDMAKIEIFVITIMLCVIYSMLVLKDYGFRIDFKDSDATTIFKEQGLVLGNMNTDYMPVKALSKEKHPMINVIKRGDRTRVLEGEAEILNEKKWDLAGEIDIKNAKKGTKIEFPFIYYPGYDIIIYQNGEYSKIDSLESNNGYVMAELKEDIEKANIKIKYVGTVLTKLVYVLSPIFVIILIIYILWYKRSRV